MDTFYTRMDRVAEYYKVKTRDLVKRCGVPYATFRSLRQRRSSPQMKTVMRVLKACTEIDARWLILGTGEMLVSAHKEEAVVAKQDDAEVARLKVQIEQLKALVMEREQEIINLRMSAGG